MQIEIPVDAFYTFTFLLYFLECLLILFFVAFRNKDKIERIEGTWRYGVGIAIHSFLSCGYMLCFLFIIDCGWSLLLVTFLYYILMEISVKIV